MSIQKELKTFLFSFFRLCKLIIVKLWRWFVAAITKRKPTAPKSPQTQTTPFRTRKFSTIMLALFLPFLVVILVVGWWMYASR